MIQLHLAAAAVPPADIPVRLNTVRDPFALIALGPIEVTVHTRSECDALIRAFLAAKDMLPADYPEQPPPDAGDSDPGGAS
jgi:hypothetical protein